VRISSDVTFRRYTFSRFSDAQIMVNPSLAAAVLHQLFVLLVCFCAIPAAQPDTMTSLDSTMIECTEGLDEIRRSVRTIRESTMPGLRRITPEGFLIHFVAPAWFVRNFQISVLHQNRIPPKSLGLSGRCPTSQTKLSLCDNGRSTLR
jgi:hypothetical protein